MKNPDQEPMFSDIRSKTIVFVSHCILNQNSTSNGTAEFPGVCEDVVSLLCSLNIGIVQIPCPELMCLGLDRCFPQPHSREIVKENTRIRSLLTQQKSVCKMQKMVNDIMYQIEEYHKYGFKILGVIGIDRSPSCGVEWTSENNQEVLGKGLFIDMLYKSLSLGKRNIPIIGIRMNDTVKTQKSIEQLFDEYL